MDATTQTTGGMERLLIKPLEAARSLGISKSKLYQLIAGGEFPVIKVGYSYRIPADALREWVAKRLEEQRQK